MLDGCTPDTACVQKWTALTSVAAIVAPQPCDLVRGAFGACYTGAHRFLIFRWTWFASCGSVSYDNAQLFTSCRPPLVFPTIYELASRRVIGSRVLLLFLLESNGAECPK